MRIRTLLFAALGALAALPCGPRQAAAQASGTVRSAVTLEPLGGAIVRVQASAHEQTFTAADGTFTLPGASGDVVVVAGARGYFYGSVKVTAPAANLDVALDPVPPDDDPDYAFLQPTFCSACHPVQELDWAGSAMGKAGLSSWVYDTYDGSGTPGGMGGFVYTRDSALAAANPASECRSCHQPEGWVKEPYSALAPLSDVTPEMLHGVSCEICHKISDIDESKPNYPGIWPGVVTLRRPLGFKVEMGVLGDVSFFEPGKMRASYQPQLRAAVCAACHQDKNDPDLDGDFEEDNGVVSEPTYLEWLASPYADPASPQHADCVDCHMPPTGAPQACNAIDPALGRPPGQIRSHLIQGTTPQFLDKALSLDVVAAADGDSLAVDVQIVNDRTGHHVPTGVTIRNMILLVEARRLADGATLAHTGPQRIHDLGGVGDPAKGYFAGLPGKLYAKVNHDANGDGPTFFTDATGLTFDTRLEALAADATHYTFALPPGGGDVEVRARVIYRRAWRSLVDAKGWTLNGHGAPLEDIGPPDFGHLMAAKTAAVPIPWTPCDGAADCPPDWTCESGSCAPPSGASSSSRSTGTRASSSSRCATSRRRCRSMPTR